jgi:hypothetical protein
MPALQEFHNSSLYLIRAKSAVSPPCSGDAQRFLEFIIDGNGKIRIIAVAHFSN